MEERDSHTVIDYAICNKETWKEIKKFRIGEKSDSDRFFLEVELHEENKVRKERRRKFD